MGDIQRQGRVQGQGAVVRAAGHTQKCKLNNLGLNPTARGKDQLELKAIGKYQYRPPALVLLQAC